MHVRCKFRVRSIERVLIQTWDSSTSTSGEREARNVKFDVSFDPAFHASTPNGAIELSFVHEEHSRHFKLGKEYHADFTPVEPDAEGS